MPINIHTHVRMTHEPVRGDAWPLLLSLCSTRAPFDSCVFLGLLCLLRVTLEPRPPAAETPVAAVKLKVSPAPPAAVLKPPFIP